MSIFLCKDFWFILFTDMKKNLNIIAVKNRFKDGTYIKTAFFPE